MITLEYLTTVLITGANSGLGYATAKEFLNAGYHVVITCRNKEKLQSTIHLLQQATNKNQISGIVLELDSLVQIKNTLSVFNTRIDYIICNAGMAYQQLPVRYSKDGLEEIFAVNHLAHFLIVDTLMRKNLISKVLVVSSNLHNPVLAKGYAVPPNLSHLDLVAFPEKNQKATTETIKQFYPNSKLCNTLFAYELAKRYDQTKTIVFNPGFMPSTGLPRKLSGIKKIIFKYILPWFSFINKGIRTPQTSAKDILFLLQNDSSENGKYYDGKVAISSSIQSYNQTLREELWKYSETLIKYFIPVYHGSKL